MDNNCQHKFTYTRDDLFSVNSIFSKKKCELCGKAITLERKYKVYIILFVSLLVLILFLIPNMLKNIFPDVSYLAKSMVAVLIFVAVYSFGIYKIMNMAVYKTYVPPKRVGDDVYTQTKEKTEEKMKKLLKHEDK